MLDEFKAAARQAGIERQVKVLMHDCRRLLSERGDGNSVAIAGQLMRHVEALPPEGLPSFFERLSRDFSPDPQAVLQSAQAYAADPSSEHLIRLTQAAEPPRQELLRRINRSPGGTAALVRLRHALLEALPTRPSLRALEADLLHLLSSWFNPGFLQMRRVDWNAPAQLLEKLIQHEAVHQIDGWDDLRRRLMPDRRCFAFFHPQLEGEPLIFVEVALVPSMPAGIGPLIDKAAAVVPPSQFKVATFYSISNCQPGLRGVSLGNFLIKRVADELQREVPQIRTFCTLSPIPGLAAWLARGPDLAGLLADKRGAPERALQALKRVQDATRHDASALACADALATLDAETVRALERLAALYLLRQTPLPGGDPVARFHLDNGARLERLNNRANLSAPGLKQSFGLMVNYLYDLDKVEENHEAFTRGEVVHARAVAALV